MQEGIGRGGYRVLASVFFGVAALGVVLATAALEPVGLFEWLGLALAGLGLVALAVVAMVAMAGPARAAATEQEPAGAPMGEVELETPEPPLAPDPDADLGMEYEDFQPISTEERMAAGPPPRIQPPPVPITQPRRVDRAKAGWPERADPSGVTRRQMLERNLPRDPGPAIEVDGPAPPGAPPLRREPPVVMARTVASAEASGIPEGSGIGKCGNCGVLLLAPKKRPIRLKCPRCERVHTLG